MVKSRLRRRIFVTPEKPVVEEERGRKTGLKTKTGRKKA